MTLWICATCGIEHADTPEPQEICAICADERQYLMPWGQRWTTLEELQENHSWAITELEPDLYEILVTPGIGIGQRGLLLRTPAGNVLWECPSLMDDALIKELNTLGGVAAITASHPHLVGIQVSLSHSLGKPPIYWANDDREWIRRPDDTIQLWSGTQEVLPGVTLHQCGGHFAGSAVLHWAAGAEGRGALLVGDTFVVNADRETVGFQRSYPNLIPLSTTSVQRIADTVKPLAYDRVYSHFQHRQIATGAAEAVQYSARRYIGWVTGELHDPAEA